LFVVYLLLWQVYNYLIVSIQLELSFLKLVNMERIRNVNWELLIHIC